MRTILIVLSMSLCTFAEAQKALEWQFKMGIYTDLYSLPKIREDLSWLNIGPKIYTTFSIGVDIRKWRTMIQLNADTRFAFWNGSIIWNNNNNNALPNISFFIPKEGDLVRVSYSYFNILNALYKVTEDEGKNKIYIGLGLVGRYDSVDSIAYVSDPIAGFPVILDGYNKYRYGPALKAEYQYDISKKFFLSTHVLYGFFDEVPHSYWQFALNGGIRF